MTIDFFVPGKPVPKGSICPVPTKLGRIYMKPSSDRLPLWTSDVKWYAHEAWKPSEPTDGPIWMKITYYLQRPKCHFRTGKHAGQLKKDAPDWPAVKPDVDKLERAILDALTGVIYVDDSQVIGVHHGKRYGSPGVHVRVQKSELYSTEKAAP